jgi:hypothetical protein
VTKVPIVSMASSLRVAARASLAGVFVGQVSPKDISVQRTGSASLACFHQKIGPTTPPSESCCRPFAGGAKLRPTFLGDLQALLETVPTAVKSSKSAIAINAPAMASLGGSVYVVWVWLRFARTLHVVYHVESAALVW